MFQTNKRSLYFSSVAAARTVLSYKYIYICDQQICTLYRNREHFEYALLDRLDLLELDLREAHCIFLIIVFLIYKIKIYQMEHSLQINQNGKVDPIDSELFL